MLTSWMYCVPGLLYSLFIGALVDRSGRFKPLIFFPILGTLLAYVCMLINYIYLETLPLEVFHLQAVGALFGGMSIYYLGYYGYGAAISNPQERAHRLAIFDGSEQV